MSETLFLLCLISSSPQVARPPAHGTAPRPAQSPQVSREVCVCSGCSDSLASLMEGASRSRRPPSSRSTQACGSTPRRAFSGWFGGSRQTVKSRHFVPTAWCERCVDVFSSTASGEGLTNDCSERHLPNPESSNNPELHCVLPLDNEFDLAGLEDLEVLPAEGAR